MEQENNFENNVEEEVVEEISGSESEFVAPEPIAVDSQYINNVPETTKRAGLFTVADSNDKKQIQGKLKLVAQWLKVLAIIGLVFTSIVFVGALCMVGCVSTLSSSQATIIGEKAVGITAGIALLIGIFLLLFTVGISALIIWYTGKVQKDVDKDVLPSSVIGYVFLVLGVIGLLGNLYDIFEKGVGWGTIISLASSVFGCFLWFSLISLIKKLSKF